MRGDIRCGCESFLNGELQRLKARYDFGELKCQVDILNQYTFYDFLEDEFTQQFFSLKHLKINNM